MKLGFLLAQLMSTSCWYRIWKYHEESGGYALAGDYTNKSLAELMEIQVEEVKIANVPEHLIYDIFVK